MALDSPGVEVTVIDESFYTPSAPSTIPMIFVATAQDKTNPAGGTAQGTTVQNEGKVWLITSQRDLTDTFGKPVFEKNDGNSVHGSERSEYGLQAAYSLLGVTSRAYVARASVDLNSIAPQSSVPVGDPVSGTYWLDSNDSTFGVFEWDATTEKFTKQTVKYLDHGDMSNPSIWDIGVGAPTSGFGSQGEYCMAMDVGDGIKLWYKDSSNDWVFVHNTFDGGKKVILSAHSSVPAFTGSTPTGSVWIKTTSNAGGASWVIKYYNASTEQWVTVPAPIYGNELEAIYKLDKSGGGTGISAGSVFVHADYSSAFPLSNVITSNPTPYADFTPMRRVAQGATVASSVATVANKFDLTGSTSTGAVSMTIYLKESTAGSMSWSNTATVTLTATATSTVWASLVPAAVSAAGLTNVTASYNATTKKLSFNHKLGGEILISDAVSNWPLSGTFVEDYLGLSTNNSNVYAAKNGDIESSYTGSTGTTYLISNWEPLVYEAKETAPYTTASNGTIWYDSNFDVVDIMINDDGVWKGYLNVYPGTDPLGPIISATEPTTQQDGVTSLANGDIWVSTADMDRYGKDVYVYDGTQWVVQDVTDNSSPDGWLFDNVRWATAGSASEPSNIVDLLSSDYTDPDCPDPELYPKGLRLWNLRRSGYTVKQYMKDHVDVSANPGYFPDRWTCVTPNNEDGSAALGRFAQRKYVVKQLKSFVNTNQTIRDTDTVNFNLIACPGYPELIADMVSFNTDRGGTAFVVGDTPMRLEPSATALKNWGSNANLALDNGDDGLVTSDAYLGVFYPSGYTTDNDGDRIVVPPSHMMLRTIITSDAKSYQWFAPAGNRRGIVDNATSVGYIDGEGEFKTVSLHEGLRDTLALPTVRVNPIATFPGIGLVNFGQFTRSGTSSALDRINVARLVAYLRRQLAVLAKPFLFEPNDEQTRREIKNAAESLLLELVGQRALYDFIVVCDSSNNTRTTIDQNELYMDIAVEPVKSVEFIYIPLRIKNTGEIAAGI